MKTTLLCAAFLTSLSSAAFADGHGSTFQQTCSNYAFAYLGTDAGITATCLKSDGTPNETSITINGISNEDGHLTNSGGGSTFQQSCGSIQIKPSGPNAVILHATCRMADGQSLSTSIELGGISNNDGVLTQ
ncbi:MAG: CVNH domain-containing protein [Sulfitobacter sp.]